MKDYEPLFDKLLQNQLSTNEAKVLLKEFDSNPVLKEQYTDYQSAFLLANVMERRAIKSRVSEIAKTSTDQNLESKNTGSGNLVKIAAAVLILSALAAAYFFFSKSSEPVSPQYFAEQHFTPYPDRVTSMGENELDLSAYNRGDYDKALTDLSQVSGFEAAFYTSIAQIALKDYAEAQTSLTDLKSSAPQSYQKAVDWYLALAMLGNNQIESAKQILLQFKNDPNSNYQKGTATSILKSLK